MCYNVWEEVGLTAGRRIVRCAGSTASTAASPDAVTHTAHAEHAVKQDAERRHMSQRSTGSHQWCERWANLLKSPKRVDPLPDRIPVFAPPQQRGDHAQWVSHLNQNWKKCSVCIERVNTVQYSTAVACVVGHLVKDSSEPVLMQRLGVVDNIAVAEVLHAGRAVAVGTARQTTEQ